MPVDGEPALPVLFGGEGAGPAEGCLGTGGYADMLQALEIPFIRSTASTASGRATAIPSGSMCEWVRNTLILAAAWGAI